MEMLDIVTCVFNSIRWANAAPRARRDPRLAQRAQRARHARRVCRRLKRGIDGVLEWAGDKPELQRELHRYLISRQEDANTI
jgi:hypothetical protein